jgi:hypothetical protein
MVVGIGAFAIVGTKRLCMEKSLEIEKPTPVIVIVTEEPTGKKYRKTSIGSLNRGK